MNAFTALLAPTLLSVAFAAGAAAADILPGTTSGTLATTDTVVSGQRTDTYTILLAANQTATFTLASTAFDAYLYVVSPDGTTRQDDDGGGGTNSRVSFTATAAAAGRYTIRCTHYGTTLRTGAYTLTIAVTGGGTTATPTLPTGSTTGTLATTDPTISGTRTDRYTATLAAGQIVTLTNTSTAFDAFLRMTGPGGFSMSDDDGNGGSNAKLTFTVANAGAYTIDATHYGTTLPTGSYTLNLSVTTGGGGGGGTGGSVTTILAASPVVLTGRTVLTNTGYKVWYNESRKNPDVVTYDCAGGPIYTPGPRPSRFSVDNRTVAKVNHDAFTNSGFSRGHMAPNYAIGSHYGDAAQTATFLCSNIVAQAQWVNGGKWAELEHTIAEQWSTFFGRVRVFVGPVYDANRTLLPSGVEVPDQVFMVISRVEGGSTSKGIAFIMTNSLTQSSIPSVASQIVTIDEVETRTGFDFFPDLQDAVENPIEAATSPMWVVSNPG